MKKFYVIYNGKIYNKVSFKANVAAIELEPENGCKRFAPGEVTWTFTDLLTGLTVYGKGKPGFFQTENNTYYILG